MTDAEAVTLYPRYCFHLSPTANVWCPLRVCEIHDLDQHPGFEGMAGSLIREQRWKLIRVLGEKFYFYKNLPIKWVRIVGIVVAFDDKAGRRFYFIDDSSGATIQAIIPITWTRPDEKPQQADAPRPPGEGPTHSGPYRDLDVGAVVDVKGGLSTFRGERQIDVEKMVLVKGTAQELALWEKRLVFRRQVLDTPWVLRDKDVRRCRREAEKSEMESERKRQKKKRRIRAAAGDAASAREERALESEDAAGLSLRNKDGESDSLREIIQREAATGKYSALGL